MELEKVIYTLNTIEVRGEENLSRLLGCIQTLKQIASENKEDNNGK